MLTLRDMSTLWVMIHILILFIMLYRSRYDRKKTILLTCISMGILIVLNMAGVVLLGADTMAKVLIVTCTLPSLIFFWFISKDRNGRFFFTFCIADTVALWISMVTNVLDLYLGGQQYYLMFVSRLILFPLVEWAAFRYVRKPYLELQEATPHGWGIFAGMTALYYILLAIMSFIPAHIADRPQELPAYILVLILMPMTYAIIFVSLYRQLQLYRRQQAMHILQEQKNTLEAQLEKQQRIRKMKHDMKGYTATLSGLLTAGKTKEALSYLKGVETELDVVTKQFCINPYLNAVFSHYAEKMEEIGAVFTTDVRIGEEKQLYMELCQILSNGLENACNALKELTVEKRAVSVQMRYNGNYLLIHIRNRCREDLYVEKGTMPATEQKGQDHGFGLVTIKEAVQRLDGEVLFYTENAGFVLDAMIPCRSL